MKQKARDMIAVARRLANRIEAETGLAAVARLDDHLLDSRVIVSLNPRFRKPGCLFEYLQDPEAGRLLKTSGLMEAYITIPPHKTAATMTLGLVRREATSRAGEEAFVTHDLPRPLADEIARLVHRIQIAVEQEGFAVSPPPS